MSRRYCYLVLALASVCLVAAWADSACAQGGRGGRGGRRGGRGFGPIHQVTLATLPEVQTELKLTDDQKTKVEDIDDAFNDERRALRGQGGGGGGGGGDAEAMAARVKLNADFAQQIADALEEPQAKRLQEIYIQVNGTSIITDEAVATALKITDEQKEKLTQVADDNRQAMRDAFENAGDMTRDERQAKNAELTKAADDALLAVLTEEQRTAFEGMKGEKLELDVSSLRGGFGGGGGRGGRGGRGGGNADGGAADGGAGADGGASNGT